MGDVEEDVGEDVGEDADDEDAAGVAAVAAAEDAGQIRTRFRPLTWLLKKDFRLAGSLEELLEVQQRKRQFLLHLLRLPLLLLLRLPLLLMPNDGAAPRAVKTPALVIFQGRRRHPRLRRRVEPSSAMFASDDSRMPRLRRAPKMASLRRIGRRLTPL